MARGLMIGVAVLAFCSTTPSLAQTSGLKVVREAAPVQKTVIIANSAQDIALQEEIRRIRAYNAYVDKQVGISEATSVGPNVRPQNVHPTTTKIELFAKPETQTTAVVNNVSTQQAVPAVSVVDNTSQRTMTGQAHVIVSGDTLYSLARTNCIAVTDIQSVNDLSGANIRLGQSITIPSSQCASRTIIAAVPEVDANKLYVRRVMPVPTSIDIPKNNNYAVLPKDTLYSIGKQYCLTAKEIASFNGFNIEKAIKPGQILRVPSSSCFK
ncbi:MAG: hypothetical protein COA43_10730 [Robiginitomaculum sp.]|nr:MAG: hypothetical protein COA43_10730 [Robiginitomaculum sp.]